MRTIKSWKSISKKKNPQLDVGKSGSRMKAFIAFICTIVLIGLYKTTNFQYQQAEIEAKLYPFDTETKENQPDSYKLRALPRGIVHTRSDLELRPLWSRSNSKSKLQDGRFSNRNLLAMSVGIKQKKNVDTVVRKFLSVNFTVTLFHYDSNLDGWWDLKWSNQAIHLVAQNQTKWWFAKRFLHPDVVSIYDYIFLWDEDLDVKHFDPERYLKIVKSEGLEISQPALDANSTEIHHKITLRSTRKNFHKRVSDKKGSTRCSNGTDGPPCSGFVEGMAPVFTRSAWYCTWHLIQNDLVHGWGMDIKLGYCAQGDRTRKVGIIDREFVVHQGIQTLGGGGPTEKTKKAHTPTSDPRSKIRRQSTWELEVFKDRWSKAVEEDKEWVDPFRRRARRGGGRRRQVHRHHGG